MHFQVKLNDEIDVVKSYCPLNPLNIIVARIEILNTAVRDEKIIVTARRHKNYTIDNYEGSNAFKSNLWIAVVAVMLCILSIE